MTQFAISADFLTSLSYLPRQARRQVGSFVFKFRQDPRSSGINLERIQGARDRRLFSVRINDDYRGVVARPDGSDTVLLLWVDKHDDAYAWARRRRCEINPETGALQIVDVQTVEETAAETPTVPVPKAPALFDEIATAISKGSACRRACCRRCAGLPATRTWRRSPRACPRRRPKPSSWSLPATASRKCWTSRRRARLCPRTRSSPVPATSMPSSTRRSPVRTAGGASG